MMRRFYHYCRQRFVSWQEASSASHEREFLPAALEILETPASPMGRSLSYLIMGFFVLAVFWAWLGEVDINAVATGQLVPEGGVKPVQSLEAGIVRRIHVANGMHVKSGQPLIELDSTENQVDVSQLQRQRQLASLDIRRLKALLNGIDQQRYVTMADDEDAVQTAHKQRRLSEELSVYFSRERALGAQLAESRAVIAGSMLEQEKLEARLKVVTEKAHAWKTLMDQKMGARLQWLDAENEKISTQKSLAAEKQRTLQYTASIARLNAELAQYRADARRQYLAELLAAEDRVNEVELSIRRYREREQSRTLRAPVSGYVQQLVVQTIGGVVQPAQQLLVIAPDNATLAVDAKVMNRDIGFVRSGQEVTIKVDSYPYSKYGTLRGTVEHLSRDAVPDEKKGPIYDARIKLSLPAKTTNGVSLALHAGMTASVEIRTDKRRVVDYLLSPITEVISEAMRER
ncbi:HlyD family type I secretion periplasmic adaptor subunit [Chromobacterium sp. ASV23]|uniref:HlyD family type I secretion periplasmic adaptor subunit n=1 Tax=Chromobacterium sp. ASV23 TaxID=2795110 RepID=UPI0018EC1256|nr:HlyD family type I secretion periplasmic adaptor subunit [Chromobacterium sp. ASV23]